jgi:hypothetical protein
MEKSITRFLAKISGQERREKELAIELATFRFRHYKSSAKMLEIALENCMRSFPDFLEKTNCIEHLTLMFNDSHTRFFSIFLLPDLRRLGFNQQAEALGAITDNWYLPLSKRESDMTTYIELLRDLFNTPDPQ